MEDIRRRIFPWKIPDSVRRVMYATAGPVVTLLSASGMIPGKQAAAWSSLAVAGVTLLIAVVNCESQWRNAVYLTTAALQAVLQRYGIGSEETWAATSGIVVSLLGIGLAAAFTPSGLHDAKPAESTIPNTTAPSRAVPAA